MDLHEQRIQLINVAHNATGSVGGVLDACITDIEDLVKQLDVGTERCTTAGNNIAAVMGAEGVTAGAVENLATQIEALIDETHALLNRYNEVRTAQGHVYTAVGDLLAKVIASPNN